MRREVVEGRAQLFVVRPKVRRQWRRNAQDDDVGVRHRLRRVTMDGERAGIDGLQQGLLASGLVEGHLAELDLASARGIHVDAHDPEAGPGERDGQGKPYASDSHDREGRLLVGDLLGERHGPCSWSGTCGRRRSGALRIRAAAPARPTPRARAVTLAEKIADKKATLAIVGIGRVGLPLAIAFAGAGLRVMGIDVDPSRRRAIELGKMPFDEPGGEQALLEAINAGTLTVHGDPAEAVPNADVIILCVPTPLAADLRADYEQLRSALDDLAPHLRPGQLLVLRSTVSPGTLLKVVHPHLMQRVPGVADLLLLAACPERIAEGKALHELRELPEIVGGKDPESTDAAAALFGTLDPNKVLHLTDPTSAELA